MSVSSTTVQDINIAANIQGPHFIWQPDVAPRRHFAARKIRDDSCEIRYEYKSAILRVFTDGYQLQETLRSMEPLHTYILAGMEDKKCIQIFWWRGMNDKYHFE